MKEMGHQQCPTQAGPTPSDVVHSVGLAKEATDVAWGVVDIFGHLTIDFLVNAFWTNHLTCLGQIGIVVVTPHTTQSMVHKNKGIKMGFGNVTMGKLELKWLEG